VNGLAVLITLLQGPGAIHNFARDVEHVESDVVRVVEIATTGVANTAEEVARRLRAPQSPLGPMVPRI
jgi:hypothetical protein